MSRYTILWIAGLFAAAGAGFTAGRLDQKQPSQTREPSFRDEIYGRPYEAKMKGSALFLKTEKIEHFRQVFQVVGEHNVGVEIRVTTLSDDDLASILEVLSRVEDIEPILNVEIVSETEVRVMTGEIRGPLNGGGHSYTLKAKDGKWTLEKTSVWVS